MDVRSVLRKLVTNEFMPHFDYKTVFSFKTVFSRTHAWSYCCCTCGFENEFLEYIGENGDIDEHLYETVVQNILDGQCPHVSKVSDKHVAETSISALDIAAAVNTKQGIKSVSQPVLPYQICVASPLFGLHPLAMAAMKKQHEIIDPILESTILYDLPHCFAVQKSMKNPKIIVFEEMKFLEFCSFDQDSTAISTVFLYSAVTRRANFCINLNNAMEEAYGFTHTRGLQDFMQTLISIEKDYFQRINSNQVLYSCLEQAIVFDKPEILKAVLEWFPVDRNSRSLLQTCAVLKRTECERLLLEHGVNDERRALSDKERMNFLLGLLSKKYSRDKIKSDLKAVDDIRININKPYTAGEVDYYFAEVGQAPLIALLRMLGRSSIIPAAASTVVKILIELGADIEMTDTDGNTVLDLVLLLGKTASLPYWFRQILEVLLFENVDVYGNQSAVQSGLYIDNEYNYISFGNQYVSGHFMMDAQPHSMYGHEDGDNFELNYTAPFLIECGAPVQRGDLEFVLSGPCFYPSPHEKVYFEKCLTTPKSLKRVCRDVLRKHFKGRAIHTFLSLKEVPNSLKDYLLLKPILLCQKMP